MEDTGDDVLGPVREMEVHGEDGLPIRVIVLPLQVIEPPVLGIRLLEGLAGCEEVEENHPRRPAIGLAPLVVVMGEELRRHKRAGAAEGLELHGGVAPDGS